MEKQMAFNGLKKGDKICILDPDNPGQEIGPRRITNVEKAWREVDVYLPTMGIYPVPFRKIVRIQRDGNTIWRKRGLPERYRYEKKGGRK